MDTPEKNRRPVSKPAGMTDDFKRDLERAIQLSELSIFNPELLLQLRKAQPLIPATNSGGQGQQFSFLEALRTVKRFQLRVSKAHE